MAPKQRTSESEDFGTILKEIRAELKSFKTEFTKINAQMTKIEKTVTDIEHSLNHHSNIVEEMSAEISELKVVMPSIKTKTEILDEAVLNKSVEILGIPHHSNESVNEIISTIASKKSVDITAHNIDLAYRNKSKKAIVVRFVQTQKRNEFFKSIKAKPGLTAKDIGYKNCESKIYVNDYLSYENRILFHKVREFKRENEFKYAWSNGQRIFLRQNDESQAIRIKQAADLDAISV